MDYYTKISLQRPCVLDFLYMHAHWHFLNNIDDTSSIYSHFVPHEKTQAKPHSEISINKPKVFKANVLQDTKASRVTNAYSRCHIFHCRILKIYGQNMSA